MTLHDKSDEFEKQGKEELDSIASSEELIEEDYSILYKLTDALRRTFNANKWKNSGQGWLDTEDENEP